MNPASLAMIAYVLDDLHDCRKQLLERAGYRVLTYGVKDLVTGALVKPVLADMNQHGKGILWIRPVGPNTNAAQHGYGTQTFVHEIVKHVLGLGRSSDRRRQPSQRRVVQRGLTTSRGSSRHEGDST